MPDVRTDLPMGNLETQTWDDEIVASDVAKQSLSKVAKCEQNCWTVTAARTAMRSSHEKYPRKSAVRR